MNYLGITHRVSAKLAGNFFKKYQLADVLKDQIPSSLSEDVLSG